MRTIRIAFAILIACAVAMPFAAMAVAGGGKEQSKTKAVTKTIEAKVRMMDPQKKLLSLKLGQTESVTVRLDDNTKIRIDGKAGKLDELKTGDLLVVTYEPRQEGNLARLIVLNRPN